METKYKLLDPVAMGNDPAYTTCGPYTICATLEEEHDKLISDSDWPTLTTKSPESNSAGTNEKQPNPENPAQYQV